MKSTLLRLFAAALTSLFIVGAYAAEGDKCTPEGGAPDSGVEDANGMCVPAPD